MADVEYNTSMSETAKTTRDKAKYRRTRQGKKRQKKKGLAPKDNTKKNRNKQNKNKPIKPNKTKQSQTKTTRHAWEEPAADQATHIYSLGRRPSAFTGPVIFASIPAPTHPDRFQKRRYPRHRHHHLRRNRRHRYYSPPPVTVIVVSCGLGQVCILETPPPLHFFFLLRFFQNFEL